MKSKGGFILVKINKDTSLIGSMDIDKKLFKDIFINKVCKPLILETNDGCFVCSCLKNGVNTVHYVYNYVLVSDGNIDGYTLIDIVYNAVTDELTLTLTEQ